MLPDVRSSTDLPNTCGLYAMLDRTHERRRLRAAAAFLAERERAAAGRRAAALPPSRPPLRRALGSSVCHGGTQLLAAAGLLVDGRPGAALGLVLLKLCCKHDAVEKVRRAPPSRNNRILRVNFLNQYCASEADLESIVRGDPQNLFPTASTQLGYSP